MKINKQGVADSFSKAALSYDENASLQLDIGNTLLANIGSNKITNCLDLGSGTGAFSSKLLSSIEIEKLYCFDLSRGMLNFLNKDLNQSLDKEKVNLIEGDLDFLPFRNNIFDLVYSNLVMQWSQDLENSLSQLYNCLKTGGELHLSTLTDGSLYQLTDAWKTIDDHKHTNSFLKIVDVEMALKAAGFKEYKLVMETKNLYFKNIIELMRSLKGIGANHVHGRDGLSLQGKDLIKKLNSGFKPFIKKDGFYPLTYKVCYIRARK